MRSVNSPDAEPFRAGPRTARWRKSSRCAHGDCVEVGSPRPATVAVRDTKHHGTGPSLAFTPAAWRSFITEVKHEAGR
jgi:Domain of unknown function (DUF397)